jgi:hypothetical protein
MKKFEVIIFLIGTYSQTVRNERIKKLSVLQIIPRILSATILYLYAACVRRA